MNTMNAGPFETLFGLLPAGTACRVCLTDLAGLTESHGDLRLDSDRWQVHDSPFCLLVKGSAYGQSRCLRCKQAAAHKAARLGAYVGTCHMGIGELVFPAKLGGKIVAILHAGQVRTGPALAPEELRRKAGRIGVDGARLVRLWKRVPRMSPGVLLEVMAPRLEAAARFIQMFFRSESARALLRRADRAPIPQEDSGLRGLARRHMLSNHGIEIARREYNRVLRTERVAERLGVSSAAFCQAFRGDTGMSFKDYLLQVRVGAAKALLVDTGSSVTYIALETGFADPNYFSRAFRKLAGLNPSEYREKFWRLKKPRQR